MVESGYDPQGLIDPLLRMNNPNSKYRAYLYDYLESHPITLEQIGKLERVFQELPLENRQFDAGREVFLNKTQIVRALIPKK